MGAGRPEPRRLPAHAGVPGDVAGRRGATLAAVGRRSRTRCGWCRCRSRSARRARSSIAPSSACLKTAGRSRSWPCSSRRRTATARRPSGCARGSTQPLTIGAIASREPLDEASLDYLMPSHLDRGLRHAARRPGLVAEPRDAAQAARSAGRRAARRRAAAWRRGSRTSAGSCSATCCCCWAASGRVPGRLPAGALDRARGPAPARRGAAAADVAARPARGGAAGRVQRRRPARRPRRASRSVQQECPPRVLPFLAGLAQGERVPEDLRLLAVQALGNTRRAGGARCAARARRRRHAPSSGARSWPPRAPVVLAALRGAGARRGASTRRPSRCCGLAAVVDRRRLPRGGRSTDRWPIPPHSSTRWRRRSR